MRSYVARQPIFDRDLRVVAYELLFRSGPEGMICPDDSETASLSVMRDQFLSSDMATLTDGKQAFVNFTRELLLGDFALLFPSEAIVVEVLETVELDADIVAACRRLHDAGYALALDDITDAVDRHPLLDLVSFVKVDFCDCCRETRAALADQLRGRPVGLLAEKVECRADHREAERLGYQYYQGFFFSRPVTMARERMPDSRGAALRLMRELTDQQMDLRRIETVIKSDVGLAYGLLRYINSAYFGLAQPVRSLQHALVLLGRERVRRWAILVAFSSLGQDAPVELMVSSLVRGRMCELLAPHLGCPDRDQELFLLGLFSLIDVVAGCSMNAALGTLHLAPEFKDALLHARGPLYPALAITRAYEQGIWATLEALATQRGLDEVTLARIFRDSVEWAHQFVSSVGAGRRAA